ncbi:phosphate/phosphite/phosphonate ABC transporter substrate-binding protein [Mesorhizobium xinjiangense]|uniref:phosphate/phosphite/phosphonate ABC transporter substrate-binding protein n=1 Tax=Mesorhizobium xinjiangense TaxID=2678685 RepID=UPI0012ED2EAB|nr:PhnD/SsuA/transferrin family substrate-binding protein [Mesorhizobium xinjiangense]
MSDYVAALPMYDFPEARAETDAEWAGLCDRLRAAGIEAPQRLARCNADLPAVPGGIRDAAGNVIAPDPATLPLDELDLFTLWRHPALILGQTCWGPLESGLIDHVRVVGQPNYDAYEGGAGALYSSAIVMRKGEAPEKPVAAPADGRAMLPLDLMRGRRLAFNEPASMSGTIALERDLQAAGESVAVFSERIETGGHRASVVAVAEGRADLCAVDCRTWDLIRRFEPASEKVAVAGWTARRKGLPYIAASGLAEMVLPALRLG